MKNSILTLSIILFIFGIIKAQNVGINSDGSAADPSAILQIKSSDKGFLIPRVAVLPNATATPATGLLVYKTTATTGFYYNSGTPAAPVWTNLITATPATSSWQTTGNASITTGTHFVGTTDNQAFDIRTNNIPHFRFTPKGQIEILNTGGSVYIGKFAGESDGANNKNTFIGYDASVNHTTGSKNVVFGLEVNNVQNTGSENVYAGMNTVQCTTGGDYNTAVGTFSLAIGNYDVYTAATGNNNVASGSYSLAYNAGGSNNVAFGYNANYVNTTGSYNTNFGTYSGGIGTSVNTGTRNSGFGYISLGSISSGTDNIGIGYSAGSNITTGQNNIAIGVQALLWNNTSNNNIGIGESAMSNTAIDNNIAIGSMNSPNATGGSNIFIGTQINPPINAGNNQLDIGNIIYGENIDGTGNTLSTGNIGIGIAPVEWLGTTIGTKLNVGGTVKLGTNGTIFNEIIKITANKDIASVATGTEWTETFTVTNAGSGSSVVFNPSAALTNGVFIRRTWVSNPGEVSVTFYNNSGANWDPVGQDYYITLIR